MGSVGRSFRLWTAKSTRCFQQSPLDFFGEDAGTAKVADWIALFGVALGGDEHELDVDALLRQARQPSRPASGPGH